MKGIMNRAWEIAKAASAKYGYSAKEFFALALKAAWAEAKAPKQKTVAERIEELESLGFKRWQKGTFDRLYINADVLGLVCEYYKSGSIHAAYFKGERISNSEGYRMKSAKTFIDVKTGMLYSDNATLKAAAMELAKVA